MEKLMTRSAVARELGVAEGTVRSYALNGRLPSILTTTNRRLFRKSDVDLLKIELIMARRHLRKVTAIK